MSNPLVPLAFVSCCCSMGLKKITLDLTMVTVKVGTLDSLHGVMFPLGPPPGSSGSVFPCCR